MIYSKFNLTGTEQQITIVREALEQIKFPFERLSFPGEPVEIGWQDLNNGQFLNNPDVDAIGGKLDKHTKLLHTREYIFGVMYPSSGVMYIDNWLVNRPDLARATVSAEVAHNVDYFLPLTQLQKNDIMKLVHGGGVDDHTWWEKIDYNGEYFTLVGEGFMQMFTVAYSDIDFGNSADFSHIITKEQAPALRKIIGIERTDYAPPPEIVYKVFGISKVYHKPLHYKKPGREISDTSGFRACKVCSERPPSKKVASEESGKAFSN